MMQSVLIASLVDLLQRAGRTVALFETHISWVLVTGTVAYKFKKALKLAFVDFSTLQARQHYCEEELRLNRRYSPSLYLGLVRITGTPEHPSIDGSGAPLEYGVTMRAFPQQALWTHRLDTDAITGPEIDALAEKIAQFHAAAAVAPGGSPWGAPDAVRRAAEGNLAEIAAIAASADSAQLIGAVTAWHAGQWARLAVACQVRKAHGFIRECHADLHSANILTLRGEVGVFDCIEFNESLRWTDVIDDLSFACMDLGYRQRGDLAARLLNRYLDITGDYQGLNVFRFYRAQRALVRSKVAMLRETQQPGGPAVASHHMNESQRYLRFALETARAGPTAIMVMHGFSGSGKSTLARHLVEVLGAVQLRSDVERKRMLGLNPSASAGAAPDAGLYDPATTRRTYRKLQQLAGVVVRAGFPVIVDGAFLKRVQRELFRDLANELGVPLFFLNMQTGEDTMKERIMSRIRRKQDPSDAGLDTLAHQIATHEALAEHEQNYVINVPAQWDTDEDSLRSTLAPVFGALGCRPQPAAPAVLPPN